jgi:hypothetical protein
MRFFSIRILCACILLPPAFYLITVQIMERQVEEHVARKIEEIYTGDPQELLDGSARLEDVLETNINRYLAESILVQNGFALQVSVATRSGKVVFPAQIEVYDTAELDVRRVAVENFALLSEGLTVRVEAQLAHNRLISNLLLCVYVLAALATLLFHYRSASRKTFREEEERRREMSRLVALEQSNTTHLSELQQQRERLLEEFGNLKSALQNERERAERNEGDLIEEVEFLEKKLAENLTLQEAQQTEIQALREKFSLLEKEQPRETKSRQKAFAACQKRFATLYKNILVSERAVDGFMDLNEEMRLKAEEVIHQLDVTPDLVTIKRKVFGRKNRETVFEVVFAYRGRLYFRRCPDRRVEIAAIGTKNTQARELEFLAGLGG